MAGTDFSIHSSLRARTDAQAVANRGMSVPVKVAMIEIDGDDADLQTLAKYHTLVHEDDTAGTGIIIRSMGTFTTEVVTHAGQTAVIRVRTKGATPATLDDITSTDNQAVGVWSAMDSLATKWCNVTNTTDRTTYHVPAGYGIEVALTTAGYETTVSGDGTGKFLVVVEYMVLPRRITENQ
ncbi:hypothetical protein LCGC14_1797240 [marine sediment metagenome]|uniref:Uncharacterized protein n=1 Tax=marine sediment metagenome TaxID=412755 RepID=A0A0F9J5G7_9ZZZZ